MTLVRRTARRRSAAAPDGFLASGTCPTRCASRAAAILYGSVLHAKLTPWIGGCWSCAPQASTGSGMTKVGMVRLAK